MSLNERQLRLKDFRSAIEKARIVRRTKFLLVLDMIEADERLHNKDERVNWGSLGSIERQCSMLDTLLTELKPEFKELLDK